MLPKTDASTNIQLLVKSDINQNGKIDLDEIPHCENVYIE